MEVRWSESSQEITLPAMNPPSTDSSGSDHPMLNRGDEEKTELHWSPSLRNLTLKSAVLPPVQDVMDHLCKENEGTVATYSMDPTVTQSPKRKSTQEDSIYVKLKTGQINPRCHK